MEVAALVLVAVCVVLGSMVIWTFVVDASYRRHPPNPRYCREYRCIRLAGHVGAHNDDCGRSWSQ